MKQADELLQRLISQKDFSLKRLCSDYMPWVRAIHEGDKNIPESLTEYAYKYSTHPEFRSMTRHEPRVIAELMKFMHRLVRWNQFGMPVFRIDEALFSRLLLTDPSNVNPASIKPPFQTFVFTVPTGYWASDDGDGRVVSLNTNWVHNSTSISQEEAVRANRYQEIVGLPQQGLVEFVSQGGIIMLYDTTSKISEKTDLPKWLTDLSKNKPAPFQIDETRYDKEIHAAVRRVYVNLCLYIADRGKGERLPQKLEKARKKRARRTRLLPVKLQMAKPKMGRKKYQRNRKLTQRIGLCVILKNLLITMSCLEGAVSRKLHCFEWNGHCSIGILQSACSLYLFCRDEISYLNDNRRNKSCKRQ